MGALADVRADLVAVLDGNVQDKDGNVVQVLFDPEAWQPPAVLLSPADPYITMGATFSIATFRYEVLCVAPAGKNPAVVDNLETMVAYVLGAVYGTDNSWAVDTVGAHYIESFKQGDFPAQRVTVTRPAPFTT